MSSLAQQLQEIASIDASRLTSRTGAPSSKSYLFTPFEAAQQDLDEVFQIGQEGFGEICQLDPAMIDFEEELFSEVSKRTDRMMLNKEDNRQLDEVLGRCLRRLGKWIGVMACGRCLEWLVRRFRIHEMNAEVVLQVFLPYHDSPNFPRMLSILTIPKDSPYFAPFAPLVKDAQALPRAYIATAISPAKDSSLRLLRDLVGMVPSALREGVEHRAMLNFWSATIVELLEKKNFSEGVVKALVEAFVLVLSEQEAGQDVNAAVYPPLVLLTRSIRLADGPFLALVSAILTPKTGANPAQRTLTLLVLLEDRQSWTGGLGEHGSEALSKVKHLGETLGAAITKYGFAHAIPIIVGELVKRPDLNAAHLQVLIDSSALSPSSVKVLADGLIGHSSAPASDSIRQYTETFLSTLRQRHPSIVDQAILTAGAQDSIPQLLRDNLTTSGGFANVYAADVADRIRGVQHMYTLLQGSDAVNKAAAKEALLARMVDTDIPVIRALYAESAILVQALGTEYVDAVRPAMLDTSVKTEIVRVHLEFVDGHLLGAYPDLADKIFQDLVFPCLFNTPARTLFARDIRFAGGISSLELLDGLFDPKLFGQSTSPDLSNKEIQQCIIRNLVKSSRFSFWTQFLLSRISSTYAPESTLARLLLAGVLRTGIKGSQGLAREVLDRLSPIIRSARGVRDVAEVQAPLTDDLAAVLFVKTGTPEADARCLLSLLGAVAQVAKPKGSIDWLAEDEKSTDSARHFRHLSTSLYGLINSNLLHPVVSAQLLRTLLTRLSEDALIFFASIWTTGSVPTFLRISALRHALAFVNAYKAQSAGADLQMILPALLIALSDGSKEVRAAGVALLLAMSKVGKQQGEVYAADSFYGSQSNLVQLLKPAYLDQYLSSLTSSASSIILDPSYIHSLHIAKLSPSAAGNKKEKGVNRAVIASLFSHIAAWRSVGPRLALIRSLSGINDSAILKGVLPVLTPLVDENSEESKWLAGRKTSEQEEYLTVLAGALNKESAGLLSVAEGEAWGFFEGLLTADSESRFSPQIRALVLAQFSAGGVFDALPPPQRIKYLTSLIRSLHLLESDERFKTRAVLRNLPLDSNGLISALQELSGPLDQPLGKKRHRADSGVGAGAGAAEADGDRGGGVVRREGDKVEMAISDLIVLLDSRDWATLPGSAPLVAGLMGTLSGLLTKRQVIKEGVDYLEQELLGAILAILEKIKDSAEVTKSHIGIEAIIKTIRSTSNPRTSQRALLVAAELARLIPDAVLHNVMPIFTFMGAADFQRDDAYSFGVVERTVKGIVPVLVGKLRETAGGGLELWNASANFIRIFTDMAGRLPKHRTLPFFAHLVDALGRNDYLAPIAMLLIDRTTVKASKSGASIAGAIELALSVAASSTSNVKLNVVLEVVNEVGRLMADLSNEESTSFLSQFSSDKEEADRSTRRITSLLNFSTSLAAQLVGKPTDQTIVQSTVRELVRLYGTAQATMADSDVPSSALRCLGENMKLLSAENFLGVIRELAESDNAEDIHHALKLFAERLPLIKRDVRTKYTGIIAAIIRRSADLLAATLKEKVGAGLVALRAVLTSALPAEDSALAAIMPKLIDALGGHDSAVLNDVLSLLELSTRHLGPRIIPSIQPTLTASLALIARPSSSIETTSASFAVISAIIETVPTFIGAKQMAIVLRAAIDQRAKYEESSSALISVCARKIPTKVLFPVVMDLWKSVQNAHEEVLEGFFHLLRLTLKNADRAVLPSLIKTIFAFFLDVFDLRHRLHAKAIDLEIVNRVEESAIGSFLELVTKLNEATFKPLFTRLYDWAVIDLSDGKAINDQRLVERKTVLLHVMMGLLNKFRHLLSPYIGILLPHLEELLSAYSSSTITDLQLWTLLIRTLGKSFEVDEGAFWTETLYIRLIPLLHAQIALFPDSTLLPGSALSASLAALAGSTTSEPILKVLNTGICKVTRDDNVRIRLAALRCLDTVWERQVDEMVGLVPETVSEYLAELIEDENRDVEGAARGVLGRIERVTGSLKEYLE